MIRYRKLRDLKSWSENLVSNSSLVSILFQEIPELQEFTFVKNQEYDDNNYYDNIGVTSVNGHLWDGDDYEEDSSLPKIDREKVQWIEDVVSYISENYASGDDDLTIRREDYISDGLREEDAVAHKYFLAHLSGLKLPESFFLKAISKKPIVAAGLKWAVYHSLDHGRFSPETEFKLFARHDGMYWALEYARAVKGRLPDDVENFFLLNAGEDDKEALQEYILEFRSEVAA